jgi:hypothetical protein
MKDELKYFRPWSLLAFTQTLDCHAAKTYGQEGKAVGQEGMAVGQEGMAVGQEGMAVGQEGMAEAHGREGGGWGFPDQYRTVTRIHGACAYKG